MELVNKLKQDAVFSQNKVGEDALKEMELLFKYVEALNISDHFSFDFSLARGLDYYTGLIYEAVLTDTDKVGSIAGGGRYDNLVGSLAGRQIPAVGVSVGIERIFSILEEKAKEDLSIRPIAT
jgi:histidyl-tRNA synthetase